MNKVFQIISKFFILSLLIMLIAGLTLWGIGDILRGGGSETVASVGNKDISVFGLDREVSQLSRNQIPPGVPQDVRQQMMKYLRMNAVRALVNNKLMENELDNLNIELDGRLVLKNEFIDDSTIDPEQLKAYIRSMGGEQIFMEQITSEKKIDFLESAVSSVSVLPKFAIEKLYKQDNQIRSVSFIKLDKSLVDEVGEPTESELISFYDQRKELYLAPEYRKVTYASIDKSLLDEEIEEYEASQVLYELSGSLLDKLAAGATLEEAAKELDLNLAEIDSVNIEGRSREGGIVDNLPEIRNFLNSVFTAELNYASDLLESDDGMSYVVFRVDEIFEQRTRALNEVRAKVVKDWKENQKMLLLNEKREAIKAQVEGGLKSLKQAAADFDLEVQKAENMTLESDKFGTDLLQKIFSTKEGEIFEGFKDTQTQDIIVGRVEQVSLPDEVDQFQLIEYESKLKDQVYQELMVQFTQYLTTKYNVEVYLENQPEQ